MGSLYTKQLVITYLQISDLGPRHIYLSDHMENISKNRGNFIKKRMLFMSCHDAAENGDCGKITQISCKPIPPDMSLRYLENRWLQQGNGRGKGMREARAWEKQGHGRSKGMGEARAWERGWKCFWKGKHQVYIM